MYISACSDFSKWLLRATNGSIPAPPPAPPPYHRITFFPYPRRDTPKPRPSGSSRDQNSYDDSVESHATVGVHHKFLRGRSFKGP